MKDDFCSNTDLLDRDERSDELAQHSHLTELQSSSGEQDLLSNWHASDDDDEQSLRDSQLYEQLLASNALRNASAGSETFVPDIKTPSILASFLNSFLSEPAQNKREQELQLPGLGDEVFGFHLLRKLGEGTFARVYLAKQGDLAHREVVLKVSAIEGTEPETLAQLQHTHVVPIYSVHEDAKCGLRAVCMPYFGGASLNRVLEEVWRKHKVPQQGQLLVEALDRAAGPEPATRIIQREVAERFANTPDAAAVESPQTARNILSNLSFVQASAWVIARLAEGLQHSHERNVIHRDIKPSNILLSAEGLPLLLDFNVSQLVDCDPSDATLGGTLSYMSPEHLHAAMVRDASSIKSINHRSDVFSLGLVFYEMLTGELPFTSLSHGAVDSYSLERMLTERRQPVPSLRKTSPLEIPWSLESIVRKCLSPNPETRYASAGQLAEDLNRFLADQPLKFAPELSGWEQVRKWVRRHPRLTSTTAVSLLAAAVIIPGMVLLGLRAVQLQDAETATHAREFEAGTQPSLSMTNTVVDDEDIAREGIFKCQQTLKIYDVLDNPNWQEGVFWKRLTAIQRLKLSENVRELLLMLAAAEVRLASNQVEAAQSALQRLTLAEQIRDLPASKALHLDRARYLKMLKRDADALAATQLADKIEASSTHDKYMLAAAYAREGTPSSLRQALDLLSESLEQNPTHYWSHFERGLVHEETGDLTLAISDYAQCIGLWPKSPAAYFNRGHLLEVAKREKEAESDFSAAIKYDPKFWTAYFNRGLVRLKLKKYAEALADFDKVTGQREVRAKEAAGRAMALEGLQRYSESEQEFAAAIKLAKTEHSTDIDRMRWTYAFAISARNPQQAGQIFEAVLADSPQQPQAHYGLGMLAMDRNQLPSAIESFSQAIDADPNFIDPLRYRAIALARLNKFTDAGADIGQCLERERTNPETNYAAACVAAISYRRSKATRFADAALNFLEQSISLGIPKERAAKDQDFSGLWNDRDFLGLTGTAHKRDSDADRL